MPAKTSPARPKAASTPRARKSPSRTSDAAADTAAAAVVVTPPAPVKVAAVAEPRPRSRAKAPAPAATAAAKKTRGPRGRAAASLPAAASADTAAADVATAAGALPAAASATPAQPDAATAPTPRRGARPRRAASTDVALATPTPAPVARAAPAALAPPAPVAEIEPPADGFVFGRYAVRVPGEESAEVCLRSSHPGTAACSCLDFALSEHADCPHVQALTAHLQADADRAAALARGPQRVASRIAVLHGARRRLLWLPGVECPASLNELAEQELGVPPDVLDDLAVPRLLRAARDAGHELQVDEAAWAHLAAARDARWRVHRLQALFPQGPASAELLALGTTAAAPLLPLQVEGALFAVCAGRCILADTPELQPMQQALAAALLWRRHFGLDRVLLLAPGETLDHWRRALPADASDWSLTSLDSVATDIGLHRSLAPELVIVQEAAEGGLWVDADRAAALLRLHSPYALVLPAPAWQQRPAELPLRVAFVDADRLGAYEALLQAHGQRDEQGELCGLHDLDGLRESLAPVLLARPLDEVRSQLPERLHRLRRVSVPPPDRRPLDAQAAALAAVVERWLPLGWLSDAGQRQLFDALQTLRRCCAGDGAAAVAAAKAQAVRELLGEGPAPLVVFSQWSAALEQLQALLAEAGITAALWSSEHPAATRQAAARRFESGTDCPVLLVADAGSGALQLRCPGAQVLHLDRPWNPQVLDRRFACVHRRGMAHLVPVTQLLLEGSVEDALHGLMQGRQGVVTDWLDAQPTQGFLQGAEQSTFAADLQQVLAGAQGAAAGAD